MIVPGKRILSEVFSLILLCVLLSAVSQRSVYAQTDAVSLNAPEGMVLIPGGNSTIGAIAGDNSAAKDAQPIRIVTLKPFYVDVLETTNRDYARCVTAGKCAEPAIDDSETRAYYYSYEGYGRFPVVNVTWEDAKNYCEFMGKRLLTEAEWEKAAMGVNEYRRYPWGNGVPQPYYMNTSGIPGDTEMGNSYPKGVSPFGLMDTVGNVSEWVADWYDEDSYSLYSGTGPVGPETGTQRVIRGDSFKTPLELVNITNRYKLEPDQSNNETGIRCARDVRENIEYNISVAPTVVTNAKKAIITPGEKSGIFVLNEPGIGKELICVLQNGTVVDIIDEPQEYAYTSWYKVKSPSGCEGWTLASSLTFPDE